MKPFDPQIDLGNVWNTPGCFYCGGKYSPECWYAFEKIGNKVYQVPMCDSCEKDRSKNTTGEKAEE
jgi:hypothetical protein